ncbi:hypothetical protein [Streptomyces sp. NPDC058579]|uniref:hypothetical protein n=1 Tax=Streptomyces sp. NPDC058579 TaxID=3346548 RepID=UPI00365A008D
MTDTASVSGGKALLNPEMAAQPFDIRGHGVFEKVLDVPGFLGAHAFVVGSVTEFNRASDKPIMGDAVITLHSLVAMDGKKVAVRVESSWPEDLDIRVQLLWFLT